LASAAMTTDCDVQPSHRPRRNSSPAHVLRNATRSHTTAILDGHGAEAVGGRCGA
jgi:hypothetical protein